MIKNVSRLEVNVEGRIYHLYCENESPINHVKEALFQFSKIVAQVEESVSAAQKQAEQAQPAETDIKIEPLLEEVK